MASAQLPDGWEAKYSRSTGKTYFYNQFTGTSTWSLPASSIGSHSSALNNPDPRSSPLAATAVPPSSVSGSDIVHVATRLTQSAAAAPASLRKSSRSILGRLAADSTTEAAQTPRQTDTISGNVSPEPQQVHRSRSMELVHSLSKEATAAGSPMEAAGGDIRGRQQAERAVMERVSMLHKEVSEFKQKLKQREEAEDPIRKGALRVYAFVRVW
eukprot:159614-Rhodomonas_salina.1